MAKVETNMKFLECLICEGQLTIIEQVSYIKRVNCQKCGYTSEPIHKPQTEITVIKKRS